MKLEDYMSKFITESRGEVDNEYFEIEKKYEELFGHIVPTELLPPSVGKEEIINAMKRSIEAGRDLATELLKIDVKEDYIY